MKKLKLDFATSVSDLMSDATKSADSRFLLAAEIVAAQPSGLVPNSTTVNQMPAITATQPSAMVVTMPANAEHSPDVVTVEIAQVRDNPRNARKLYDPEVVNQRAASLSRDGQMTPAPACVDWENPGHFILIGGHYRKKGLLQIGATHIQLKLLRCKNFVELYRLSYAENDQRETGTPLDDAMSWQELLVNGDVKSHEEISTIVGKPRGTITKTLALMDINPAVLDVLKQSPAKFTLTAGYELSVMAPLFSETELIAIAQKIVAGQLSTRDLTALKDSKKNARTRVPKQFFSRQHKIDLPGMANGMIKDWDSGKVILEVVIADPVEREQLVNELRARFTGGDGNAVDKKQQ